MRLSLLFRSMTVLAAGLIVVCAAHAQLGSYTIVSAPFTIDATTAIPGTNLKPGAYTIRVIDNLKDRYIVAVADSRKELATFIGLQEAQFPGSAAKGPIQWANAPGKTSALRGFSFSNGLSLEFVYPKATAVELAKLNTSSVPAIDPESEGMPVDNKLSPEDRKVVSLWMLTSTRVGPDKGTPAIEAKHFQPEAGAELARNSPPPAPSAQTPAQSNIQRNTKPSVSQNVARTDADLRVKTKPSAVAARLPQTASDLPLVLLLSGLLLGAGFGVVARRRSLSRG